ncbi:hypothetical protein GCM10027290_29620 [Micromonospora sonneratiae]|uniref:Lsr2 DNA-binding domain-containing protein n=1 Tax=Micromonospora sonneratiae TaxID=1184706 RepID=A0ABW3YFF8_9ACTN
MFEKGTTAAEMTMLPDIKTPKDLEELQRLARGERDRTPVPIGIRTISNPQPPKGSATVIKSVDHLLLRAMRSENGQTRRVAERIQNLATELNRRVQAEENTRRQRLEDEVAELEMQLAMARAKLRSLDRAATTSISVPLRSDGTKSAVDAAAVRLWAANNGYVVKPTGRVPTVVIDAWRAANIQVETTEDDRMTRSQ